MTFEILPVIDIMLDMYDKPRSVERFQTYLTTLQGTTKGELVLPIVGFNPMAREHIQAKLLQLKALKAEQYMTDVLQDLPHHLRKHHSNRHFKVALNLLDDLHGGWTNRFTSDFDSKFKISGLVNRNFCTPFFWASEAITKETIQERTLEYVWRSIYWVSNRKPIRLKDYVAQETFVATNVRKKSNQPKSDFKNLTVWYQLQQDNDDYTVIFNFFYGDAASKSLGVPTFGVEEGKTGFEYVYYL
jgi:hypothetical protein